MSDSIIVRVTLDSYDLVHPSEKQTQVYVQIPEVARASWLLDADFYAALKNEPWPHVVDEAHNDYMRRGVVSDSTSAAARQAIVDWLLLSEGADYDARYDLVQAAWEADQARQHPMARKLLAENERLRAKVVELEKANAGLDDLRIRALDKNEQLRARLAELGAAQGTVFRASHDSIVMGLYTTRQAAYEHCEAYELRDDAVSPMAWNVDEDGVAELVRIRVPRSPGAESATGYMVTPLEVASEYDEEADE